MYDEFGVQEIFPMQPTQTQQQNQGQQSPQAQTGIFTAFENPFGFTGYQLDDITDMHYAQARYYAPKAGRFMAEDPIHDRLNWYGYCNSNPLTFVDPTGLFTDNPGFSPTDVCPNLGPSSPNPRPANDPPVDDDCPPSTSTWQPDTGSGLVCPNTGEIFTIDPITGAATPIMWPTSVDFRSISSVFGYRTHPVTGARGSFHNGIDIRMPIGENIYAATAGVVIVSQYSATWYEYRDGRRIPRGGAGEFIVILSPDGIQTRYLHLDVGQRFVSVGDVVHQGQLIGLSGNTGRSTGPHLHFDIRIDDEWVDPFYHLPGADWR